MGRIIGKATLSSIQSDILEVTGTTQLCTGQASGAGTAVHTLHQLFDDSCEAALLI